jgi:hypothetical protein
MTAGSTTPFNFIIFPTYLFLDFLQAFMVRGEETERERE